MRNALLLVCLATLATGWTLLPLATPVRAAEAGIGSGCGWRRRTGNWRTG